MDKYVGDFVDGAVSIIFPAYELPKRPCLNHHVNHLQFEGTGKYFFANGDRYEGDFSNGERHGQGIQFYTSGGFREGSWRNDGLVGEVRERDRVCTNLCF